MSAPLLESFGTAVRRRREALHWSQEKLAEAADLNRSYVGEIERAEVVASLATLIKLADALGITTSTLLGEAELIGRNASMRGLSLTAIAC